MNTFSQQLLVSMILRETVVCGNVIYLFIFKAMQNRRMRIETVQKMSINCGICYFVMEYSVSKHLDLHYFFFSCNFSTRQRRVSAQKLLSL